MQAILQQLRERWGSKLSGQGFSSLLSSKGIFNPWLVRLVNLLAIILLASVLANLTWALLSPDDTVLLNTRSKPASSAHMESATRLRAISNSHLFGKAAALPIQDAPIVAPETRLKLTLKGVFASSNPQRAFAIISDNKNKDKAYRLGSKLSGGAVLHAVYADRVILKRSGRLETLRLSSTYTGTYTYNSKAGKNTYKRLSRSRTITSKRTVRATAKIKKLKQTLLKDPQKIWQQVRINPVLKNGSIKGYTVDHQDKQLMRSLTLKKGDVIISVNGQSLSDPSVLYGLINQLSSQKNIEVTIERNGQLQTIQIRL